MQREFGRLSPSSRRSAALTVMVHDSSTNATCITLPAPKLRPKLIVFDLDHTLWPFTIEYDTYPPFQVKNGAVFDKNNNAIHPYPDVTAILEYIKKHKFRMAVASRTSIRPYAEQLIDLLGWTDYLKYRELYRASKTVHFSKLHEETKVPFENMLFFDNDQKNIDAVSELGVTSILVDEREGMTWDDLKEGFEAFAAKRKASKCCKLL